MTQETDLGRRSSEAAALARAGRHDEAVLIWEELHARAPENALVAAGLAAALLGAGRREDAQAWLTASCRRHPQNTMLLRLHAQALMRTDQRRAAIGALYQALTLEPDSVAVHGDLANALYLERSPREALRHALFAFEAEPFANHVTTLAAALLELGYVDELFGVLDRALAAGADRSCVLVLRSLALGGTGRHAEALAVARESVACAPENAVARHNLAAVLLLHGQMTPEAWALYDSRAGLLEMRTWPGADRRWTGGDVLPGTTVLVHAEQGFGDTIQFVRYVPMVAGRGIRVVLAVQKGLVRLLESTPGAAAVVAGGPDLPPFDLYCPLLSLPGVFGTTLDTIPPPLPYRRGFAAAPPGKTFRVGLVWAGNINFLDDRKRSLDPQVLAPLAEVGGVSLHSLQLGARTLPSASVVDLMDGVTDFADTAARIAGLDLVISVDTAVAHVAATMGKPVWLLSRFQGCWRWMLDCADTPWYPTMRIYRQEAPGDWVGVIRRVRDDLARLAAERREITNLAA